MRPVSTQHNQQQNKRQMANRTATACVVLKT